MPCFGLFGSSGPPRSRQRSSSRSYEHARSSRDPHDERGRRRSERSHGSRYDHEPQCTRSSGHKSGSRDDRELPSRDYTRSNDQYRHTRHPDSRRQMSSADRKEVSPSRRHTDTTYRRGDSPPPRKSTVPSTHQPQYASRVGGQKSSRSYRPTTTTATRDPRANRVPPPPTFGAGAEISASPVSSAVDSDHEVDLGKPGDREAIESVNTSLVKLPKDYWYSIMTQDERDLADATALCDLQRVYGEIPSLARKLPLLNAK
jgi:hypothetical protein